MKTFFKYLFAAACLCGFAACDKEEELPQDIPAPRTAMIFFTVTDADTGADLLDPAVENCLLEDVRVTYDGNVYQYDIDNGYGIYTVYGPDLFRLRWGHLEEKRSGDPYCLALGSFFCGWENYEVNFSVDWGDGGETTEVQFRFTENYFETPYLEANGVPAVTAPIDANRIPLLSGEVPPVGYFNDCWFISLKR